MAYDRQTVARDPAFARAHAGLAMADSVLPVCLPGPTDSMTALTRASAGRALALALDPLWADARFRAAMRVLAVHTCPLVRPWPVPPSTGR